MRIGARCLLKWFDDKKSKSFGEHCFREARDFDRMVERDEVDQTIRFIGRDQTLTRHSEPKRVVARTEYSGGRFLSNPATGGCCADNQRTFYRFAGPAWHQAFIVPGAAQSDRTALRSDGIRMPPRHCAGRPRDKRPNC